MPEIDISKLARLDELDAPAPARGSSLPASFAPPDAFAPPVVGPSLAAPPARAFAPPDADAGDDADAALGVERSTRAIRIESQWQREKVARQAAAALPPPKPPRSLGGLIVAVAAVAVVCAAVFVILRYQRLPPPEHPGAIHGTTAASAVSIQITAPAPTDVTIDGHAAGKTPLTLQRPPSAQPIQITSAHATRQIVPDHDQVVDLASP